MKRWLKIKPKEIDDIASSTGVTSILKKKSKIHWKFDDFYLSLGFMLGGTDTLQQPLCVLCLELLSNESMKPSKLRRHLESKHKEHTCKSVAFFKEAQVTLLKSQMHIINLVGASKNETQSLKGIYLSFFI